MKLNDFIEMADVELISERIDNDSVDEWDQGDYLRVETKMEIPLWMAHRKILKTKKEELRNVMCLHDSINSEIELTINCENGKNVVYAEYSANL